MGTKLYVGGLPYSTTEQQLQELFSQQGSVTSAKIITDRYTGQSRGFGFVEMATAVVEVGALIAAQGDAGSQSSRNLPRTIMGRDADSGCPCLFLEFHSVCSSAPLDQAAGRNVRDRGTAGVKPWYDGNV